MCTWYGTGVCARTGVCAHLGTSLARGQCLGRALPCAGCEAEGQRTDAGVVPCDKRSPGNIHQRLGLSCRELWTRPCGWSLRQTALLGFSPRICLPGAPQGQPALGTGTSCWGHSHPRTGPTSLAAPLSRSVVKHRDIPKLLVLPLESCSRERGVHPQNRSTFTFLPGNIWQGDVVIKVT